MPSLVSSRLISDVSRLSANASSFSLEEKKKKKIVGTTLAYLDASSKLVRVAVSFEKVHSGRIQVSFEPKSRIINCPLLCSRFLNNRFKRCWVIFFFNFS